MRTFTVLTAAVAAAAILATPALARLPASARTLMAHRVTITPSRELALANLTVKHARDVLGFLRANPAAGTALSRLKVALDHRWLLRFGFSERARALARIRAAARPAHYALWLCIHEGEGAWNDNTGNGYYGGLQAHYNWYGVARMDLLTPLQQMQAAERAYAANLYSTTWLWGQWRADYSRCSMLA